MKVKNLWVIYNKNWQPLYGRKTGRLSIFLSQAQAIQWLNDIKDKAKRYIVNVDIIINNTQNGITQPASKRSKKRGNRSNQTQGRMGGDVPGVA